MGVSEERSKEVTLELGGSSRARRTCKRKKNIAGSKISKEFSNHLLPVDLSLPFSVIDNWKITNIEVVTKGKGDKNKKQKRK